MLRLGLLFHAHHQASLLHIPEMSTFVKTPSNNTPGLSSLNLIDPTTQDYIVRHQLGALDKINVLTDSLFQVRERQEIQVPLLELKGSLSTINAVRKDILSRCLCDKDAYPRFFSTIS
jgi:hypothetical protein